MLISLFLFALSYYWLLRETDWLRVRLLVGKEKPKVFAQYKAYNSFKKKKTYEVELHFGSNSEEPTPDMICYNVVLDPGITEPLCGWAWLDKHCADMVDFTPNVYLDMVGVRYNMTIKPQGVSEGILGKVMKVNKVSKQQKLKYA